MFLPRLISALCLMVFCFGGNCAAEYVQTVSCADSLDNDVLAWRSLSVALRREQDGQRNILDLEVVQPYLQQPCDAMASNFSATLTVDMVGRQSVYHDTRTAVCRSRHSGNNTRADEEVLAYPSSLDLGSLLAFSTFGIRIQLSSMDEQVDLGCLKADITPSIPSIASGALVLAPCVVLLFVLLVGIIRGINDKRQSLSNNTESSELSLPGVSDCLGYLQWAFLTGGLSLHYPGFFQPAVSKLNLFSLFTTGPLTHGRVYPSVRDGIYSINGTYGGTTGLEHMHQIVGAPSTMDTWVNMMIAILIISFAVAFALEIATLLRKSANFAQKSFSSKLVLRLVAVLRVILSYFTLPLSALSFYQISAVAWLPVWHTVSAALLIFSIMMAFVWLFRQLPRRPLLHDMPKWYRQEYDHGNFNNRYRSEKLYIAFVVALTFIRGAAIGGLQIFGPVQIAVLASSDIGLLVINRWYRVYSLISMGSVFPLVRLVQTLLMICFVHGIANLSVRSAIGYTILASHACMLACGILLPAVYHLLAIYCTAPRSIVSHSAGVPRTNIINTNASVQTARNIRSHQLEDVVAHPSAIALTPQDAPGGGRHTPSDRSSDHLSRTQVPSMLSSPTSSTFSSQQYFRQPRHSSIRAIPSKIESAVTSTLPSEISMNDRLTNASQAPFKDALSSQTVLESPPSSSHSEPSNDDWHDTSSAPLHPRWNDYTFRESDSFCGPSQRPATKPNVKVSDTQSVPDSLPTAAPRRSAMSLNGMVSTWSSGVRSWWSSETLRPQSSGFEVVRPPRVLEEANTAATVMVSDPDSTSSHP